MKYTFIVLFLLVSFQTFSQCTPPSPVPVVACGTGTTLTDNANINTGQTYNYNGVGGTFSNISINGGTLVLCGSVTISNVNFNSGTIIVNSGASVSFNGSFNSGTNAFYNSGTVVFNLNVGVQGTNTVVYNAAGASITVNGTLAVFNSGLFINNGTAIAQDININGGASICLGPSSVSQTTSIQNNQTNAITVPTGNACVSYTTSFTGNNAITASSGLGICQGPAATAPVPVVIGAATVTSNCSNCSAILPLSLLSFTARQNNTEVNLHWTTAWESNVDNFIIQSSKDGQIFQPIGQIPAQNQASSYNYTISIDGDTWFRLKMTDLDGKFTYSPVLLTRAPASAIGITILANPIQKSYAEIAINTTQQENGIMTVIDNLGRTLKKIQVSLSKGANNLHIDMHDVGAGQYYLYFTGNSGKSKTISLYKP